MTSLTNIINDYNDISRNLKDFSDRYNSNQMSKTDYESWLIYYNDEIKRNSNFKTLKDMGNDIFLAGVDWLE